MSLFLNFLITIKISIGSGLIFFFSLTNYVSAVHQCTLRAKISFSKSGISVISCKYDPVPIRNFPWGKSASNTLMTVANIVI